MNIFSNIQKYKDNVALIDKNVKITYKELIFKTKSLKKFKKNKTIIFLICENTIDCITLYIGLIKYDIKVMLLSKKILINDLDILIKAYKPKFIFKPSNFGLKTNLKTKNFYDTYQVLETNYKYYEKIDNNLSVLISTSGTSGNIKYVALSRKNLLANTNSIIKYLKLKSSDQTITTLNLNYSFGFSIINTHIYSGSSIVITEKSFFEREFWTLFKINKITNFSGVPSTFQILNKIKFLRQNLSNLRFLTAAGGKLDNKLLKTFTIYLLRNKIDFFYMYGQTEASPRMSFIKSKDILKNLGSIGKSLNNGKLLLLDKKNQLINKANKLGNIHYIGPNIMLGYVSNKKDLEFLDNKIKILKTGDIGYFNKNSFYYITGRESRYIKIDFIRFNLDELEKILLKYYSKAVCIGSNNALKVFIIGNV